MTGGETGVERRVPRIGIVLIPDLDVRSVFPRRLIDLSQSVPL